MQLAKWCAAGAAAIVLARGAAMPALRGAAQSPYPRPGAVEGRVLVSLTGRDSHIATPTYLKVTTDKEWTALWQRHTGKQVAEHFDKSGMPRVNFGECMVIGAFHGDEWNNDGLFAVSLTEAPDRFVLRFANRWFQTAGPGGGGQKVRPYGIFVVPKSAKPVVVEEATSPSMVIGARDLTYKERARL